LYYYNSLFVQKIQSARHRAGLNCEILIIFLLKYRTTTILYKIVEKNTICFFNQNSPMYNSFEQKEKKKQHISILKLILSHR